MAAVKAYEERYRVPETCMTAFVSGVGQTIATDKTYHIRAHDLPTSAFVSLDKGEQYTHRASHASTCEVCKDIEREFWLADPRKHLEETRCQGTTSRQGDLSVRSSPTVHR